jgi:chorismate dehydratase
VFAAWISNKNLPEGFVQKFNEANRNGLESIEIVVTENKVPFFDLNEYYSRFISYQLTEEKKIGLDLFLAKLNEHQL